MRLAVIEIAAVAMLIAIAAGCAKKQHELKAAQAEIALDSRASGSLEVAQSKGTLGSKPRK